MKIKISEATELQLDWLVAKCENAPVRFSVPHEQLLVVGYPYMVWQPHAKWSQGGPIIEREEIGTKRRAPSMKGEEWEAMGSITARGAGYRHTVGPTPLVAAMRCYVISKLGEEVEIPKELEV